MSLDAAAALVAKYGPKIAIIVGPQITKYLGKDHGSKVKRGTFKDCSISMYGDKACIVVDDDAGVLVCLTSDTVRSYQYLKDKIRMPSGKRYYYYHIVFKDGQECDVRMRKKYRKAMERDC